MTKSPLSSAGTADVILFRLNLPVVRVPVLSKNMVETRLKASRKLLPLNITPCRASCPIPPKYESGMEITRAHGQDTTRNIRALFSHSLKDSPKTNGGTAERSNARITTTGV